MAKDKFFELSKEKQEQLLKAAKEEFSNKTYEEASINKIIKSINLARGSFYLYFDNKEDLYLYILKSYIEKFREKLLIILNDNDKDIFKSLIIFYDEIVKTKDSNYNLVHNLFINMNSKQLDIAFPKVIESEINGSILNTIDFSKYDISFEERKVLLSILMPILFHSIAISFDKFHQISDVRAHYIAQLNIIKRGLERKTLC